MKKRVHLRILMEIQAAYFEILAQSCSFASHNNKKNERFEIAAAQKPKSLPDQAAVLCDPSGRPSFRRQLKT